MGSSGSKFCMRFQSRCQPGLQSSEGSTGAETFTFPGGTTHMAGKLMLAVVRRPQSSTPDLLTVLVMCPHDITAGFP